MAHVFACINLYLLRYLLTFLFATTAVPSSAQHKVMVLGNSITQGNTTYPGYRYELWKMLIDANIDVDLVGSHDVNDGGDPAVKGTVYKGKTYTNRNEGHWGWSTDEVLNGRDGKGRLAEWLQGYTPDMVLLHLGTNDMFRQCDAPGDPKPCYQETIDELKEVVRQIRAKNAGVIIFMAKLIPAYDQKVGPASADNITSLNELIPGLVQELNTPASPVVLVDQQEGFDATTGQDTHDGIHPNTSGELKMAQKWQAAMEPFFTTLPVSLTAFTAVVASSGIVQLAWQTASEKNNAYFEVQRAISGTDFIPIGHIKGAGNTQTFQAYHFADTVASAGDLYYRLLQVDEDGTRAFSKIVHVAKAPRNETLQVYPTASDGSQQVTIQLLHFIPDTAVEVRVISAEGKLVDHSRARTNSGGSLTQLLPGYGQLGAGLYVVHVYTESRQLQRKFIIGGR
ncbi:GDSL-type esterase/lipase family protein [Pontibacter sp. E15-1]|uniref:GDSL-type esterase/lipase family protein n=1 Tax=Pontibacter sp. E15-1 TaxID=2919918 RepID=UPI001F4FC44C|nr:GDSL-type esterase/lipase family protein [Pontibacter sp. E15-1]MCJ8165547.1 GDSL-type esterase/lipase family protein [Pontibacter sp. E15-1]